MTNLVAKIPHVPVVWRQRPFVASSLRSRALDASLGIPTIAEIVAGIPENELPLGFAELGEVRINGDIIPRGNWRVVRPRYRPDFETVVTLHIPLGGPSGGGASGSSGGKSTLALVATIAVLLVAAVVSAGALGLGTATIGGLTLNLNVLAAAGIGIGGALEVNALRPRA